MRIAGLVLVFLTIIATGVAPIPAVAQFGENPFATATNRNQESVFDPGSRGLRCISRGFVAGPEVSTVQVSEVGQLLPRNGNQVPVHQERELSFQLVYWDWSSWRWREVATVRYVHIDFSTSVHIAWEVGQLVRVETSGLCDREVYSPSRIVIVD